MFSCDCMEYFGQSQKKESLHSCLFYNRCWYSCVGLLLKACQGGGFNTSILEGASRRKDYKCNQVFFIDIQMFTKRLKCVFVHIWTWSTYMYIVYRRGKMRQGLAMRKAKTAYLTHILNCYINICNDLDNNSSIYKPASVWVRCWSFSLVLSHWRIRFWI